jgi:hypothetical protein
MAAEAEPTPVAERQGVKSLAKLVERKLLKDLTSSLTRHARSATFACGGSVPVGDSSAGSALDEAAGDAVVSATTNEVQIRFGEYGKGFSVVLPGSDSTSEGVKELLSACLPASSGRSGEAVLDEEYRKAGKLDEKDFATNFCVRPHTTLAWTNC